MPRLAAVPEAPEAAVDYRRVSMVGSREEIISPDIQGSANHARAAADRWTVVATLTDIDRTGRNFTRTGIREAIAGVEEGRWRVILVYRYDRFGRNVRDSLVNIARVEAAGGRVVSATEPFDPETAVGKYGRTNLLAVAELQSDLIGEGWKAAHANRRARGLPHSGSRRLGYVVVDKRYVPDEDGFAPAVRELYRRYIAGQGMQSLAEWLNSIGAPTRTKGRRWTSRGVRSYLFTGFAAGLLHYSTTDTYERGSHEPLIDEATWEAFLAANRRRQVTPRRQLSPLTPFSGVVRCGTCGRGMRTRSYKRSGPAYLFVCENYDDCAERGACTRAAVEAAVLAWLADYDSEVSTRARARDLATDLRVGARAERKQLEHEITRLDKALVKLTKDHATGLIPDGAYVAARDEFAADKAAAEVRLTALAETAAITPPSRAVVRGLLADWDVLSVLRRREILRELAVVRVWKGKPKQPIVRVYGTWEDAPVSKPS